eukprot:1138865-Pelagomonas_calceolata.AAC.4
MVEYSVHACTVLRAGALFVPQHLRPTEDGKSGNGRLLPHATLFQPLPAAAPPGSPPHGLQSTIDMHG